MLLIAISDLNCRRIVANEYSVRHAFHTVNTEEAEIPAVSLAPAMPATTNQQYDHGVHWPQPREMCQQVSDSTVF